MLFSRTLKTDFQFQHKKQNHLINIAVPTGFVQVHEINKSTNQQIIKSTNQQINESTYQQINKSTNQQFNKSTNQQIIVLLLGLIRASKTQAKSMP